MCDFEVLAGVLCPAGTAVGRMSVFGSAGPFDAWPEQAAAPGSSCTPSPAMQVVAEKQVDTAIVVQALADSYELIRPARGDRVVLVSGDGDYTPLLRQLSSRGIRTHGHRLVACPVPGPGPGRRHRRRPGPGAAPARASPGRGGLVMATS